MVFLRPSGAIAIAFAAFPLLSAVGRWQMTLFLTAHRRDHRLAAPLTASLVGARWTRDAAFREGRRRHHHDQQSVLPGGPCRRVQYLCCAYASPPDGVSSRARLCGDHGKTLLSSLVTRVELRIAEMPLSVCWHWHSSRLLTKRQP